MKKCLLIFGYGQVAQSLSKKLPKNEWDIFATSRNTNFSNNCHLIDFNKADISNLLPKVTHILVSIAPQNAHDVVLTNFQNYIVNLATNLKWIGYLSSTSVYGDHEGNWVNENSETKPTSTHGINRLKSEQDWKKFSNRNNISLSIFRLAGIYSQNNNPLIRLREGKLKSIHKKNHVFSRIHLLDIARILKYALYQKNIEGIYNIADDFPCSSLEVNNYAANMLNISAPTIIDFDDADLSEMARGFYNDNKKISNQKIKDTLGIKLQMPTYKEGLENSIKL